MADIRPTPVSNYPAYYGAGLLSSLNEAVSKPFGYENDPVRALTNLLGVPGIVKTLENTAYGMPNVTGTGMATQLRPESKEAVGTLLPMAPGASNLAAKGIVSSGKYVAPEFGRIAEQYAVKTGLLQPIVSPEVARQIPMKTVLPTSEDFISAVKNTPNAQITNEGLLIRVQRNQVPEQSGMESVRTGVFYLPEGSSNARYYKNATAGYGGKESIAGETLLKNPLFVKGATGGKAPEMAFDAVKGKGALKALDDDVNRIVMGSSFIKQKDPALYEEMVAEFLRKYGSDQNMAGYIIKNSQKGNQLKYALRENAIANTVRNAGYDSVLGYSKGKKGNFISEIFDVREATYPTKEGGFTLNEKFKPK